MAELHLIEHPVMADNLTALRDEGASSDTFRRRLRRIAELLGYKATRDLPLMERDVRTPVVQAKLPTLAARKTTVVAILRAGMGMVDGMLDLLPQASVGFLAMQRDEETLKATIYYSNLPDDIADSRVFVVDPMLATGGSAIDAVQALKDVGCKGDAMRFLCVVAAPEGVAAFRAAHPDVELFAAALDEGLNEHGYIVPGLGDAGDRVYGTC